MGIVTFLQRRHHSEKTNPVRREAGSAHTSLVSSDTQSLSPCSALSLRGSPPTTSTSSSSLTSEVPKQPGSRELGAVRPSNTSVAVQYTPHSHQFPRTRKMFDKGPEQVRRTSLAAPPRWALSHFLSVVVYFCASLVCFQLLLIQIGCL